MGTEIQSIEFAAGFASGVLFLAGVLWTFIILPLKKEKEEFKAEAASARDELKNRLIEDLAVYRRSRGSHENP